MAQSVAPIQTDPNCAFCKIINRIPLANIIGGDGNQNSNWGQQQAKIEETPPEHFYADDQFIVIRDIKPRATHHYLVIPRQHTESAKTLNRSHVDLVRRMVEIGAGVLKEQHKEGQVDLKEIQLGFHWPPMVLIKHLHLHVIYPASEMSFFSKNVVFRSGFLFVTPDWLIEHIEKIPDPSKL